MTQVEYYRQGIVNQHKDISMKARIYWNTKMKQYEQVHNEHQQMLSINPLKLIWIQ